MPRQLILGDLSPKNIGVDNSGKVHICDLENVHIGNAVFDLGFLVGHFLIHTLRDADRASSLLESLLGGYSSVRFTMDTGGEILKRIVLGTILYRLDNQIIPYGSGMSNVEREAVATNANAALLRTQCSWHDIVMVLRSR
jgi:Ser/Thr protein kinase RdoA (MazF antagonist)